MSWLIRHFWSYSMKYRGLVKMNSIKATRLTAVLIAALLLTAAFSGFAQAAPEGLVGKDAPFLTYKDSQGNEIKIGDGKVAIIYFWQTNCSACSTMIPFLNRMQEEYGPKGLVVLGIGVMESVLRSEKYKADKGAKYPLIPDQQGKVTIGFGINLTPSAFVIRPDGKVAMFMVGYKQADDSLYEANVRALLGI